MTVLRRIKFLAFVLFLVISIGLFLTLPGSSFSALRDSIAGFGEFHKANFHGADIVSTLEGHHLDSTLTSIETTLPGDTANGFTVFDRLYLRKGTFFIVTSNASDFPPLRDMIAPGMDIDAGHDLEPTPKVRRPGLVGLMS